MFLAKKIITKQDLYEAKEAALDADTLELECYGKQLTDDPRGYVDNAILKAERRKISRKARDKFEALLILYMKQNKLV